MALPNSISLSLLRCLNSPWNYSALFTELLNYNPPELGDAMLPCFVLRFPGKRGALPEESSWEAVSTLTAEARASEIACRLCTPLGLMCKTSDAWSPHCGSGDGELSDKSPFLLAVAEEWGASPWKGRTESGDAAATTKTGQEQASALQHHQDTHLERMWEKDDFVGGFCHLLLTLRGPQIAVH